MNPPPQIDGAQLISYLVLSNINHRTGNTEHIVGGTPIENFHGLAICQYQNDNWFYLFYCDSSWEAITDTYHASILNAKEQAEFEYTNTANAWLDVE